MQWSGLKILLLFSVIITFGLSFTEAQSFNFRLKTADSLFQAKRYTQSFEHYEQILKQKQFSPAMLLKMAYIQEGLKNIGRSMYYLNLYFLTTNDKTVEAKMNELASKHNLEGYEPSDTDQLLSFYHDYYLYISLSLAAVIIFFLNLGIYTKVRLHKRPIASVIAVSIVMIGLFIHLHFGEKVNNAIITNATTYIMEGPSAGASVVEIVKDGHRVEVLGKKDVWMKIRWDGNIAYVKENSIMPIQL
jgi:hypothetical protein